MYVCLCIISGCDEHLMKYKNTFIYNGVKYCKELRTETTTIVWKPEEKSLLDRPWSRYKSLTRFVKRHLTSTHLTVWGGLNFLIFLYIVLSCAVSLARTASKNDPLLYIKRATSSGTYRLVSYSLARHLPSQHIVLANCETECVKYDVITKATTPPDSYTDLERSLPRYTGSVRSQNVD